MPAFLRLVFARILGFVRSRHLDRDFEEELQVHLAMAEEEKIRQGLSPTEARRVARVELGGVTQLRESGREARGLPWLGTSWLDVKLGLRMLRKSWGLTLVAGMAMTVVIGIAIVAFDILGTFGEKSLPLDEGERVVAIQTWDAAGRDARGTAWRDFDRWRKELESLETVGAFRLIEHNLFVGDGPPKPVAVAQMTASGFDLARVPPVLGRRLLEEDELEGSHPVVVIGFTEWQRHFAGDSEVVGRQLRLGETVHTVVGVMPEDFEFPLYHHFWTPLQASPADYLKDPGPAGLVVFGRLVAGLELEAAQAELTSLGLLPLAEVSQDDSLLEPRLVPYVVAFTGEIESWMRHLILLLITLLLVPPCANIAILVYARTVTRQDEFAARHALGASRGHIVLQLFVEVLVLAAAAGGVALFLARLVMWQLESNVRDRGGVLPFWMDFGLSLQTVLFVAVLVVFAATISGLVPALQATGRRMEAGLRSLGSRSSMRLGVTWTMLVVVQVAFSFALLPTSMEMAWGTLRSAILGPGFAAEEFLTARLEMGDEGLDGFSARFASRQTELTRRLREEPWVAAVSATAKVPGEEPWTEVELEGVATKERPFILELHNPVRSARVDEAFLDLYDVQVLTGRGFEAADFEPESVAVVVNRSFVRDFMGEEPPLGRRLRYSVVFEEAERSAFPKLGRWYEIVGVAADLRDSAALPAIYHPAAAATMHPVSLSIRVRGSHVGVSDRLREITTALDPSLRIGEVRFLDTIYRQQAVGNYLGASALLVATLSVLLLSAAGIYAFMSFTLNQRRKEIAIRAALGAQPARLVAGIFGRAIGQVALGAGGGFLVAALLSYYLPVQEMGGWNLPGVLPGAAAVMIAIALLAVLGPARRGLRVDPIDQLREG